jgi:hypothetical protein
MKSKHTNIMLEGNPKEIKIIIAENDDISTLNSFEIYFLM